MKIRKRILIIILVLLVTVSGSLVIYNININSDPLKNLVISCKEHYKSAWKLSVVCLDSEKTITICFDEKKSRHEISERNKSMSKTFHAIYDVFLGDLTSDYQDYSINIQFRNIGDCVLITNINKSLDFMQINNARMSNLNLKDLSLLFPEAKKICIDGLTYSNIQDIKGFYSLVCVMAKKDQLSDEEKEVILSLYPDCQISEFSE